MTAEGTSLATLRAVAESGSLIDQGSMLVRKTDVLKLLAVAKAAREVTKAQMTWITSEDDDAVDVPLKYERDRALMELVAEVAALEALGE